MRRSPLPAEALDATDRAILNRLQDGFPLSPALMTRPEPRLASAAMT